MTSETREEERERLREEFEEELGNLADAARDTTWLVDGSHARRDRAHAWLLARYDAMAADAERLDWLEEQKMSGEEEGVALGWYVEGATVLCGELAALWSRSLRGAIDYARQQEMWRLKCNALRQP